MSDVDVARENLAKVVGVRASTRRRLKAYVLLNKIMKCTKLTAATVAATLASSNALTYVMTACTILVGLITIVDSVCKVASHATRLKKSWEELEELAQLLQMSIYKANEHDAEHVNMQCVRVLKEVAAASEVGYSSAQHSSPARPHEEDL